MSDNPIDQPVIPLPDGFTWGFVTARAIHAMADTARDFDRYPEARGSNGRAIFTPMVRFNKHLDEPTAFVQYEVANARIREGTLVDAQGQDGIWLISGDYQVSFQIDDGSIPGFPITVTEEHTQDNPLDLVTYSPVQVPPGYTEIVRVIDRERAEDAAEAAEGHAEEARIFGQADTFEDYVTDALGYRNEARGASQSAAGHSSDALVYRNEAEGHSSNALDYRNEAQDVLAEIQRRIVVSDTEPSNPQEGDIWLDTSVVVT